MDEVNKAEEVKRLLGGGWVSVPIDRERLEAEYNARIERALETWLDERAAGRRR
jgi:hypothetical protein